MEKYLYCTTSTNRKTLFYIDILETGWIYDVFLILTCEIKTKYEEGEYNQIQAKYFGKTIVNNKTYSRFIVYDIFRNPSDFVVSFFIYTIKGITYVTDFMCFDVEDEK